MEPEESEKERTGPGQENDAGTGTSGHEIMDKREKDPAGHPPHTLPGGMAGADQDGTGPDAVLQETGRQGGPDKKPVITPPVTGVERKTELQGMSMKPCPDNQAQIRRRTERDLKDPDADIPYAKTEKAVRDLVCSLLKRQDRMNTGIFLEIISMQEDIGMLKDQVYKLKTRKTGPAAGTKR